MSETNGTTARAFRQIKPGYRVADDGTVWSCVVPGGRGRLTDTWRQMKPTPQSAFGHMAIWLGREDQRFVHRLVLEAFVGPCPEGMQCRHLDGNPANNRLDNLKWGSNRQNSRDRIDHNRSMRGENSPQAKLTENQVREIVAMRKNHGSTIANIARWYEVSEANIQAILYGVSWSHVTGIERKIQKSASERVPRNSLTAAQVREIVSLVGDGIPKTDVAARMGVSMATVMNITKGKTWGALTGISRG